MNAAGAGHDGRRTRVDAEGFEARAARLDRARRDVDGLEGEARAAADELASALQAHHEAALRSLAVRLRADARGRELLVEALSEPEIHTAFVKAGIVRPSAAMKAVQVLEGLRPFLTANNGDAELVGIEDGVAYVRLLGSCRGCAAEETLRAAVADALLGSVPELHAVREAEEAANPTEAFVPIGAVGVRRGGGRPIPSP